MARDVFRAYDVLGNIAIVKFSKGTKIKDKKQYVDKIMQSNKSIKTVLEKTGKFSGRLRKQKTKYVAGLKSKEVLYKENNCVFRFNVDKTYFSPRLSNERKEIASQIKKGNIVLVMFAGVGPFPVVIAKNTKAERIYANEINREANKYAKLNIELNKVKDKIVLLPGDVKRVVKKITTHSRSQINNSVNSKKSRATSEQGNFIPNKFDVIIMPRPQLRDTFLKEALLLSKKNTRIFYYDFANVDEINKVVEKIKSEAKKFGKKIKILKTKKAGEIGPYKVRVRVDFLVL